MGGDGRAGNAEEDTCPSNSLCCPLCMVLATVEQVGPCTASMEWGAFGGNSILPAIFSILTLGSGILVTLIMGCLCVCVGGVTCEWL